MSFTPNGAVATLPIMPKSVVAAGPGRAGWGANLTHFAGSGRHQLGLDLVEPRGAAVSATRG